MKKRNLIITAILSTLVLAVQGRAVPTAAPNGVRDYDELLLHPLTAGDKQQEGKFGKPSEAELNMTECAQFPGAEAVVLSRTTTLAYDLDAGDYRQDYVVRERLKVLKSEGSKFADVEVLYVDDPKQPYCQEDIKDVKATAYNIVDGKTVKTPMADNLVFKTRISKNLMMAKFSIPQVREGTLVEYEYRITGNRFYAIRDWYAQGEIPVLYAHYDCTIPVYFLFNMEKTGLHDLETEVKKEVLSYKTSSGMRQADKCYANRYLITGRNLPPLKDDDYVWHAQDYCAHVTAELQSIHLPNTQGVEYTKTWEQIDELLLDDSDFGKRLNDSSKFKDELTQARIDTLPTVEEKLRAAFLMMNRRLTWNGQYALVPDAASQVLKKGSGTNADLNMVLINMLHDVGVKAVPVVMRTRDKGLLPVTYPSIDKLNTFIVGVRDGGRMLYLDASATYGDINVLPPRLCPAQARVVEKGRSQWVNLQKVARSNESMMVSATLTPDGRLAGTLEAVSYGNEAADRRRAFLQAADSATYVAQLGSKNGIDITAYEMEDLRAFTPSVKERITFTKQGDATDSHIYINPFVVLPLDESPFTAQERLLPVEFPYATTKNVVVSIDIPEGYEVEELPKTARLTTPDNSISGLTSCTASGQKVTLQFRFTIKELLFEAEQYSTLKQLADHFSEACQAMLVLKKK